MCNFTTARLLVCAPCANRKKRTRFARALVPPVYRKESGEPEPVAIIGMSCQFPKAGDAAEFWQNLEEGKDCISEIRHWLNENKLKLNDEKTEFMVIAPPKPLQSLLANNPHLTVGTSHIQPSTSVRNLGATFDNTMSMVAHVNIATRGIYYQLQRIKSIRSHLSIDIAAKIINALVTSGLDFNNGLLVGLPEKTTARLQLAQNSAARLLTGAGRREHITPHLEALHWLPVCQRIKFKTLTMIHKAVHSDTAPSYLKDLVCTYTQNRTLRSSSDTSKLVVDKVKNSYGQRVLSSTGATWWNHLPLSVRSSSHQKFKKELKTILFKEYFY